jgi:hypothetical protein
VGWESLGGESEFDFGSWGCGDAEVSFFLSHPHVCGESVCWGDGGGNMSINVVRLGRADEVISYEHHSIDEPAILLGGAFVVDVVEREQEQKNA